MISDITEKTVIPADRALTVVDKVEEEEELELNFDSSLPVPPLFSLYQLPKDGAPLPVAPHPYYPVGKDGLYLYREMLFGRGYIPQKFLPKTLKTLAHKYGLFEWNIDPVPASVCAAALSFFRHIFELQHTEAEVLLLFNKAENDWKLLIPTQEVSYSGVSSVYEPADIPTGYALVGSIHSHCDFGAFHSGTDTSDAADFDGLHITLGKIDTDTPEIAAMVMINKVRFDYDHDVEIVADFSNLDAGEADPEWDKYVTTDKDKNPPEGVELFAKYKPAVKIHTYTPPTTHSWQSYTPYDYTKDKDLLSDNSDWDEYFKARYPSLYPKQDSQEGLWEKYKKKEEDKDIFRSDYWEDGLPKGLADIVFDSETLTEADFDHLTKHTSDGVNPIWWRMEYLKKLSRTVTVLNALGILVDYKIEQKKFSKEDAE